MNSCSPMTAPSTLPQKLLCSAVFSDACNCFDLTISTKKTEMIHQPAVGKTHTGPNINMRLNAVEKFAYLGSTLSRTIVIDDEVNIRLAKASVAFGRFHKSVGNRRAITTETKIKVHRAMVLTTLLYECKTRTVYKHHARKVNNNTQQNPRHKMARHNPRYRGVDQSWPVKHLLQSQLRWACHMARMLDHRLSKKLLFGELRHGKHSQGGQRDASKRS